MKCVVCSVGSTTVAECINVGSTGVAECIVESTRISDCSFD